MKRGFKSEAERRSVELRSELGLAAAAPLPARELAAHLGISIVSPAQVPGMSAADLEQLTVVDGSSWSAATIHPESEVVIILNDTHAATRQESNLMHEIAHVLCRHPLARLVQVTGGLNCLREYDADLEEEANWLGACLQLPRPGLLRAAETGMTNEEISQAYTASVAQVRQRRGRSGVDVQVRRRGFATGR